MTPSQQAKYYGLKSLKEVADLTDQSVQTLINWHRSKPKLFTAVCIGANQMKNQPTTN